MRWLGGSRRDSGPLCWCRRQVYLEVMYGLRNGGVSKRVLPLLELDGVVGLRLGSSLRAKRGGPGGCRSVGNWTGQRLRLRSNEDLGKDACCKPCHCTEPPRRCSVQSATGAGGLREGRRDTLAVTGQGKGRAGRGGKTSIHMRCRLFLLQRGRWVL